MAVTGDRRRPTGRPTFDLISVPLPHRPWSLLPGGQAHSDIHWNVPGFEHRVPWTHSDQPVLHAYQTHLAQVGAVDTLLGRVVARLRAEGLYDDALVVVISDHGQAFTPGEPHRATAVLKESSLAEIASVPFFIKFPGQTQGRIDDRPAEVKDLFATIMDVVGVDPGWPTDARSLVDDTGPAERVLLSSRGQKIVIPSDIMARVRRAATRKFAFTGLPQEPKDELRSYFTVGRHRDLVGRTVTSFARGARSPVRLAVTDMSAYRDVDLDSLMVPSALTAFTTTGSTDRGTVVVAVNERIAAVTELVRWDGRTRIDALFWPGFLRDGANEIELFELDGNVLQPIAIAH